MRAKISSAEQGTEQWFIDRMPYLTASDIGKAMAKGEGKTRRKLLVKKVCEELTGRPQYGFKSKLMDDGNLNERHAREAYEGITGCKVEQIGFAYLEDEKIGASSDGLVGDDGLIEIKNVIADEQIAFFASGKPKGYYMKQMQVQMYVLDRKWCDFVSLSLGDEENGVLPEEYQFKKIRVNRDEQMITLIRKEAAFFHHDLQKLIKTLKEAKNV